MKRLPVAVSLLLMVAGGCNSELNPTEKKLIGKWDSKGTHPLYLRFNADRSFEDNGSRSIFYFEPDGWSAGEQELVLRYDAKTTESGLLKLMSLIPRTDRLKLIQLGDSLLEYETRPTKKTPAVRYVFHRLK